MSETESPFDQAASGAAPIVRFAPAARKGSHVLIGIYGFSGSGKTLCALYLARGLVGPQGRIAMIDTETGRGLIYAMEAGGFDHAELTPPFTPERYIEAIRAAETAGYDALILDSASHEWEGIGGVVETADASSLRGLVKWASPKARHKKFVQALLNTRMHIIVCLRGKEKMIQVTTTNAKKYPTSKVGDVLSDGMISIQDKRFIYEQTVQVFLPLPGKGGLYGVPVLEKCPKDLLAAFPTGIQIGIETGKRIAEWVAGGIPVDHTADTLMHTAEEAAEGGTDKMRTWWAALAPAQQKALAPALANLRSIAATADEDRARQIEEAKKDAPDARLDAPFGKTESPHSNEKPSDENRYPSHRPFRANQTDSLGSSLPGDGDADSGYSSGAIPPEPEAASASAPAHPIGEQNGDAGAARVAASTTPGPEAAPASAPVQSSGASAPAWELSLYAKWGDDFTLNLAKQKTAAALVAFLEVSSMSLSLYRAHLPEKADEIDQAIAERKLQLGAGP
jgi:hypothetical protein